MRHRRAARATTLLWAAALTLTQIGGGCRALTFELPSNGVQKCFYEHAKQEVIMEANFRVIGKDYDNVPMVDAEVKTPQGKQVLKEMQKTRGHLDFVPAVDGVHAFCFRQHTRGKKAILSLNIRSGERDSTTTSIAQKGACVPARRGAAARSLPPAACRLYPTERGSREWCCRLCASPVCGRHSYLSLLRARRAPDAA